MKSRSAICLICERNTYISRDICNECFSKFLGRRWRGCCRCGNHSCMGCDVLSRFSSVTSLFTLDSAFAAMLTTAKDKNDALAQHVFENLFSLILKNTLQTLLKTHGFTHIVLAPLREGRAQSGHWHPTLFFKRTLEEMQETQPLQHFPFLIAGMSFGKSRQAQTPTRVRQQRLAESDSPFEGEIIFRRLHTEKHIGAARVLIIDDVLTSGETAVTTISACEAFFENCHWHLLTLFRTPLEHK